jgi:hypothetical protein
VISQWPKFNRPEELAGPIWTCLVSDDAGLAVSNGGARRLVKPVGVKNDGEKVMIPTLKPSLVASLCCRLANVVSPGSDLVTELGKYAVVGLAGRIPPGEIIFKKALDAALSAGL